LRSKPEEKSTIMSTTRYSPEELIESGKTMGGRVSVARREILRVLGDELPALIKHINTRDNRQITQVDQFRFARTILTGFTFPAVLVGATAKVVAVAPRVVTRVVTLEISCIAGHIEGGKELDDMWDVAELCEMVLKPRKPGHCLPDGRRAWNTLDCQGYSDLPEKWSKYDGVSLTFTLDQRSCSLWEGVAPPTQP
jgi:hypothetical protein